MISIITAIHNQIGVNRLFLEKLKKYTYHPFELIIIDNKSDDGSRQFFEENGAIVIKNDRNYSYPFCQNQGIEVAKYSTYAFLNNDIIVAPHWDKRLLECMQVNELDIVTCCGIERLESPQETRNFGRRWKRIKNPLSIISIGVPMLRFMHTLMYGNWERFSAERFEKFGYNVVEGFVGNTVVFNRRAVEKIGLWDERIQAADFDLYIRSKKRNMKYGDLKPCHIALGVFNHHFIRLTVKSNPPVFADIQDMLKLEEKWTQEELDLYLKDNVTT